MTLGDFMKILIAYSSKTKNTKKVALELFEEIKDLATVDIIDIKKTKKQLPNYDLYILGCWVDKATANKNMQRFVENHQIANKNVALFMTCGVPDTHYHAIDSINNFKNLMIKLSNNVIDTFICQGKIDPKILIVFKFLTWRDPNFIHKIDQTMLEWVESSKTHPNAKDFKNIRNWGKKVLTDFSNNN